MRPSMPILLVVLSGLAVSSASGKALDAREQWGSWRGPEGSGAAPAADPPVRWSETENVRWKTPLPGLGHSSPVVWGDRVFLTSAVPHGGPLAAPAEHDDGAHHNMGADRKLKFVVLALDRRDGSILWQTVVRDEQPHEGAHESASWASNSPVTDGERVYASFGSRGVHALDREGRILWSADLGDMRTLHGHGEGSSPALAGDTLVVSWDHEGDSFLVALDRRTGEQRWKVPRDEITSWSSPLIVEHGGRHQVIVAATKRVRAYDLADGSVLWEAGGLSRNVVASPVAADGLVFAGSSYDTRAMMAIRLEGARGDLTGTPAVVWTRDRDTPYVPSPVLDGGVLCFLKHYQGILTCVDGATGAARHGPARLPGIGNVYSSPVAAAGRIYVTSREGRTVVLDRAGGFRVLAENQLHERFSASAAVVGDEMFLRGESSLYCIGESGPAAPARGGPPGR